MRDLSHLNHLMKMAIITIDNDDPFDIVDRELWRVKKELDEYFHPPADLGIRVGEVISTGDVFGE